MRSFYRSSRLVAAALLLAGSCLAFTWEPCDQDKVRAWWLALRQRGWAGPCW